MTILEFVEKYKKTTSEKAKDQIVKDIITRRYCPVLEKRVILEMMLEKATGESEDGVFHIDRLVYLINYTLALIVLYTSLEPDRDDDGVAETYKDYDALIETGLIGKICDCIGMSEMNELNNISDTLINNVMSTSGSVQTYVSKIVDRLYMTVKLLADRAGDFSVIE